VIDVPRHALRRLDIEQDRLRLKAVEVFALPDAVDQIVRDVELVIEGVIAANSEVVVRQKIEQVRARVVDLILSVVPFEAERPAELAEIRRQTFADRRDVRAVSLPDRAESLWE